MIIIIINKRKTPKMYDYYHLLTKTIFMIIQIH
nr:MAG TPA: hypothetical protein [Caudoviricetes sp.]